MDIIYFLIGCSIVIAMLFLVGFIWSIRSGQYDDTYTPSIRMLFDTPPSNQDENKLEKQSPNPDSSQEQT